MTEFQPTWTQPSHPGLIEVVRGHLPFTSAAKSKVSLPAGALFAYIETAIPVQATTYTSVATALQARIELMSDLVYCNHSCNPSLEFDMTRMEVRVSSRRPLQVGDDLTFFYPSTEWEMVQPFKCTCGAGDKCLGYIAGSAHIEPEMLIKEYWLNDHIRAALSHSGISEARTHL